ncbi:MAG: aspartate/tyrosine/aromatic aminotransferase [bacterium]|nr:aspartate/tyrosine/aromatic aminotransferase [bacterium]
MLDTVQAAPPDPILGLSAAYDADPNPAKINLGVGEYRDAQGSTPVLASVHAAEARIVATSTNKRYLPIDGTAEYGQAVRRLLFGEAETALRPRCATVQAPGGTGALRIAGDFVHAQFPGATVWLSEPTWANHPKIFAAAGLTTASYAYYDSSTHGVDIEAMIAALERAAAGDMVLLHGCCHNPTGADLSLEQWQRVGHTLVDKDLLPLVDFAYQGFGSGLEEDAAGLRALLEIVPEALIASSFSKNFGLYQERVGALTVVTPTVTTAANVLSQLKVCVRTNFSNPPAHGSAIVTEILTDATLQSQWQEEVAEMRGRINGMRTLLVDKLQEHGAGDFSYIADQRGMFSFSGLTQQQVAKLRSEHAVYIVGSGRINVAGITAANVDGLCLAIAAVV